MSNNSLKLTNIIKNIENVGALSSDELVEISYNLFKLIKFCKCVNSKKPHLEIEIEYDYIKHTCDKFDHHDHEHTPFCKCCQTKMLTYYLGKCMEKLADEDKLLEFDNRHLSSARIRDRTFGFKRKKSIIQFRIYRHHNAWNDPENMYIVEQIYEFNFENLSLKILD